MRFLENCNKQCIIFLIFRQIRDKVKVEVAELKATSGHVPGLAIVQVREMVIILDNHTRDVWLV